MIHLCIFLSKKRPWLFLMKQSTIRVTISWPYRKSNSNYYPTKSLVCVKLIENSKNCGPTFRGSESNIFVNLVKWAPSLWKHLPVATASDNNKINEEKIYPNEGNYNVLFPNPCFSLTCLLKKIGIFMKKKYNCSFVLLCDNDFMNTLEFWQNRL